ncbi:hypothetical protein JA1_001155 [Spathaspora sp. JA1]|nr:hypothetical protein JA1_001155 [Spathaspora sp. JA1]
MRGFGILRWIYIPRSNIRLSPLVRIPVQALSSAASTSTNQAYGSPSIFSDPGYIPGTAEEFHNNLVSRYRQGPQTGKLFLEDLAYQEKLQYLVQKFQKNKILKEYLLKDMVEMITSGKNVFRYVSLLSKLEVFNFQVSNNNRQLCHEIITTCIQNSEVRLASLFLLQFRHCGITDLESLNLVVLALCASKTDFIWNSYYLIQIIQQCDELKNNKLLGTILVFLTSNVHAYYFGNYLYNKMSIEELKLIQQSQLNEIITQLIEVNLNNADPEAAFAAWNRVAPLVQPERCINALLSLFHSTENSSLILQVLNSLPQAVLETDAMIDFQLEFYGTRDKYVTEFDSQVPKLTHPLRRSTLTSFLKVFLYRNDEAKTDKVIENIFKHEIGIQQKELDWIINKLLKNDKQTEALNMIRKFTDANITAKSYVSIFRYIATKYDVTMHDNDNKKIFQAAFEEIGIKLVQSCDDTIHELFTTEIFNYLTSKIGVSSAIRSYMKVIKSKEPISFNHFGMPLQFNQILKFSQKNTIQILQIIAIDAVKQQNNECLQWAIAEYRRNGWTFPRIFDMLRKHDTSNFLKRMIKPQVIEQMYID